MSSSSEDGNDSPQYGSSTRYEEEEDNPSSPTPKKLKREWGNSYSLTVRNMMEKMGYKEDKGLGKSGQGRIDPIEASTQEGRRGFGLKLIDLEDAAIKWDSEMELISIPEQMKWLKNDSDDLHEITMTELEKWVEVGIKKLTIDDETKFCEPEILENILNSKNFFNHLSGNEMRSARTRSNPFETIQSCIFLNRAAMKMANIDSRCDYMLTNPIDEYGEPLVKGNNLLYFADICAGPGGFSEYVLYRKKWEAKGFGFTLRGSNDFQLQNFYAGPPETFNPHYGEKDDGNIFDPVNIESFTSYVMQATTNGVHIVMADGGFSVEGEENIQEILSKQLYLCQCLVALSILRDNGHFVVKLFDTFTPFSVGLIYLMYKCFKEICIFKPNTSRPANSERYLICKWKKSYTSTIQRHLFLRNVTLWENKESDNDITQLVRYEILMEKDPEFCAYVTDCNNEIGQNQIAGLMKIAAYCNDTSLKEQRQQEFKKKCLMLWNIPDCMRKAPQKIMEEALVDELLGDWRNDKKFLNSPAVELTSAAQLQKYIRSPHDWYFVPVDRPSSEYNPTFFMSRGYHDVLMLTSKSRWTRVNNYCLEISAKTLIYGEIVSEWITQGRTHKKSYALHIIDGLVLGGRDIRRLPLQERLKLCEKFALALNKPPKRVQNQAQIVIPIRCKKLYALTELDRFFDYMSLYKLNDSTNRLGFKIRTIDDNQTERFFVPGGIIMINEYNPRFSCHISKKCNKKFYVDTEKNNESFYEDNIDPRLPMFASFRFCFYNRLLWQWSVILQVDKTIEDSKRQSDILYRSDLSDYIKLHF